MSRPKNPTWLIPVWAPDTNYGASANPWSLTPSKVDHPGRASVGFTPKAGVPAQCINRNFSDAYQLDGNAKTLLDQICTHVGQLSARNWFTAQSGITNVQSIKWVNGVYYAAGCGSTGAIASAARTFDAQAWPTADEIAAQAVGTTNANFDVATDGSQVIPGSGTTDGKSVSECTSGGTWTKRTALWTAGFLVNPDVVFEPVSGNWIIAGHRNAAALVDFYTSSNRTAWTARTAPASIPADGTNGANVTLASNGLGTVVAQLFPSSLQGVNTVNSLSFSCSTDGGVTWSAVNTHVTTFGAGAGSAPFSKPVWTGTKWVATIANNSAGNLKTHVYNSSDGATWTEVKVLTSVAIMYIAADGDLIIGLTSVGKLVESIDAGVTWKLCGSGLGTGGTYQRLFAANGGFVATDKSNAKIKHSLICGDTDLAALT